MEKKQVHIIVAGLSRSGKTAIMQEIGNLLLEKGLVVHAISDRDEEIRSDEEHKECLGKVLNETDICLYEMPTYKTPIHGYEISDAFGNMEVTRKAKTYIKLRKLKESSL